MSNAILSIFATAAVTLTSLCASLGANAQEASVVMPDKISWLEVPSFPGVKVALIQGNPGKPGPYTLRAKFPPNYQLGPHTHSDNRVLTVIAGSWQTGFGEKLDAQVSVMPAGGVALIPAGENHFDIAGSEGAEIQVTGTGEAHTTYRDQADDPQNKYKN